MNKTLSQKIARLEELSSELFDLANSLAGDETGTVACSLHGTVGRIWDAIRMLKAGVKPSDKDKVADEWCDSQAISLDSHQREIIKSLLRQA